MKDCLFGTMDEFIETGYAPSNRATCRGCRTRIEKDTVRLGECTVSDHFNGRLWFHLDCFKLKPLFSTIDPKKQVFKLE